jgi:hypothetical protein
MTPFEKIFGIDCEKIHLSSDISEINCRRKYPGNAPDAMLSTNFVSY